MASAVWTGTLAFGLVSVGVKMFAARERHGPTTHQFVRGTSSRVRYQRVNEDTGKPVDLADVVKGVQHGPDEDEYVFLEPEDLERIQPGRSKTLEIEGFIRAGDVAPLWFANTYYLGPDKSSAKPYRLLLRALGESGRAGLGRMIMRDREHLVLVTPQEGVLTASTLYWHDEVREPEDVMRPPAVDEVDGGDLELASQLIDAMVIDWDPVSYHDEYDRRLEQLVEAQATGSTVSYKQRTADEAGNVVALDDALRQSIRRRREDRRTKGRDRAPAPRRSRESTRRTKAELLERARDLGVQGRSKMSRDQLAEAVDRAG
ncbi:Ku protein [Nocardiopsis sp. CT-R113]|uniref:Non-homologous end joining protein Ku n=1 Tax=Nocardiopsis codii TaxID=3065942 RepID=A0ABU7KCU3_9ACTN|nr:Ku protein [Nocardiopsis sp. CT-R113]MEE2040058.1 Ku protein [Nocardiopsis sp. CT-R113]